MAGVDRQGPARIGTATAWQARRRGATRGEARKGGDWQAGLGSARRGPARHGEAGKAVSTGRDPARQARYASARRVVDRFGKAGKAGSGEARFGGARQAGWARFGDAA